MAGPAVPGRRGRTVGASGDRPARGAARPGAGTANRGAARRRRRRAGAGASSSRRSPINPLRERLWAQRMLAAAPLRTHRGSARAPTARRARCFLDELGIEPGPELRALQARILADDPRCSPAHRRPRRGSPSSVGRPSRCTCRSGRPGSSAGTASGTASSSSRRAHQIVTVVGAAGCGKTRLAIEVARAAAAGFPDGVWSVDLTSPRTGTRSSPRSRRRSGLALPGADSGGGRAAVVHAAAGGCCCCSTTASTSSTPSPTSSTTCSSTAPSSPCWPRAASRSTSTARSSGALDPLPLPADACARRRPPSSCSSSGSPRRAGPGAVGRRSTSTGSPGSAGAVDGVPLAIELAAARARAYSLRRDRSCRSAPTPAP